MIRNMGLEFILGLMGRNIMGCGSRGYRMEMGLFCIQIKRRREESGRKVRGSGGLSRCVSKFLF